MLAAAMAAAYPSMASAQNILAGSASIPLLPGSTFANCPGGEAPHVQCVEVPAHHALDYWVGYTNLLYGAGWRLESVAGNGVSFGRAAEGCVESLGLTYAPSDAQVDSPTVLIFDLFPENKRCERT